MLILLKCVPHSICWLRMGVGKCTGCHNHWSGNLKLVSDTLLMYIYTNTYMPISMHTYIYMSNAWVREGISLFFFWLKSCCILWNNSFLGGLYKGCSCLLLWNINRDRYKYKYLMCVQHVHIAMKVCDTCCQVLDWQVV